MTSAQKKLKGGAQAAKNRGGKTVQAEDAAPRGAVPVPRQNQKGKAKAQDVPEPQPSKVIDNEKLFPAIERVKQQRGDLTGTELKRILWWNDQGQLTASEGKSLDERIIEAIGKPLTAVENSDLPLRPFMQVREEFGLKLPDSVGGATLTFKKRAMFAIFQGGSAWISENVLWLPKSDGGPKARLMIHAILNWDLMAPPESEPDPHITLRSAETQAKIDLDTIEPIMNGTPGEGPEKPRITLAKEATTTSFSRGLGQPRKVGAALGLPEEAKKTLESAEMKAWLVALAQEAQRALIPQPTDPTKV